MRRIVVCGDDFGLSPQGDAALLALAEAGALSAISAFADGDPADEHFPALRGIPPAVSVGLHFNLTEPLHGATVRPLPSLLLATCLAGRVDARWVADSLERQCARIEERLGRAPDFIDGHQHVHQLPVVRDILLAVVARRYGHSVAIRSTQPLAWRGTKAALIGALGGRALRAQLVREGIATNADFAGAYDFSTRVPYATRIEHWLRDLGDHGLLMCHPCVPGGRAETGAREAEFAYLSSAAWPQLRQGARISLVPFGSPFPP